MSNSMSKCLVAPHCEHCILSDCEPVLGCLKCGSVDVIRYGHNHLGGQNYYCKSCGIKFRSGTRFRHKQYDKDIIQEARSALRKGMSTYTVRDILRQEDPKLSASTVWRWGRRNKVCISR